MDDVYELSRGNSPLLVSIPHSGTSIPLEIKQQLTAKALRLTDTDWFIPELYNFIFASDVTVIKADFSRLVIDLNRPPDNRSLYQGTLTTDLCPLTLFDGGPVYQEQNNLTDSEIRRRKETFWKPYHTALLEEISRIKSKYGYCILYDAHSIRSTVPNLFDNKLPDLNLGTNNGNSCHNEIQRLVESCFDEDNTFSSVVNGRFIGGYITRHYGSPEHGCHALQMEIAQSAYMDENTEPCFDDKKALQLKTFLEQMIGKLASWAQAATE